MWWGSRKRHCMLIQLSLEQNRWRLDERGGESRGKGEVSVLRESEAVKMKEGRGFWPLYNGKCYFSKKK